MPQPGDERRGRRDPDALLRATESDERAAAGGRLKVFLGYGADAAISFRLFDEGRRRRDRGEDVVVAAAGDNLPDDVGPLVGGLDAVPMRRLGNARVIDVEAVLARQPSVCLVDGLAGHQPDGARHPERWQDVEDLLAGGLSVVTWIRLEQILEQQPLLRAASGSAPTETVPQDFVLRAQEVVLVDAPAGGDAGPDDSRAELRERALLLTAEAVDGQLERYLQLHGLRSTWGTRERILVCMTPRANAARMLAAGRRNADHFHGELFAVYVLQPNLTDEDRLANERNATLARAQQAQLAVLAGADAVETILEFAERNRITQIFLGHTLQRGWRHRWRRTTLDRLIREARTMDVRVFPQ